MGVMMSRCIGTVTHRNRFIQRVGMKICGDGRKLSGEWDSTELPLEVTRRYTVLTSIAFCDDLCSPAHKAGMLELDSCLCLGEDNR